MALRSAFSSSQKTAVTATVHRAVNRLHVITQGRMLSGVCAKLITQNFTANLHTFTEHQKPIIEAESTN